jgi:hypothetical protein
VFLLGVWLDDLPDGNLAITADGAELVLFEHP